MKNNYYNVANSRLTVIWKFQLHLKIEKNLPQTPQVKIPGWLLLQVYSGLYLQPKIFSALEILVLKHRCKCRMQAYELVFQSKLVQMWHIIVHDDLSILNWRSKTLATSSGPRGCEILLSMKAFFIISFTRENNWNTTFKSA